MKKLYNKVDSRLLKDQLMKSKESRTTLSFYQYAQIKNPQFFRDHLYAKLNQCRAYGRIYVAHEGVNAQISVPTLEMDYFRELLNEIDFLANVRLNVAIEDDGKSFYKLVVKLREKILADGLNDDEFDSSNTGVHLSAIEFNNLVDQEDTVIIDMRNHYEHEVGHFKGALLPDVETFRESLPIVLDMLEGKEEKNVVMYCTGGIRCEKASAFFKHNGFKKVHQVNGGIIEYARQVEKLGLENKFVGKNFVFDDRLGERITEDVIAKCHQCGGQSDQHVNCANDACHILFIQCDVCAAKYEHSCSIKCKEFNQLSEVEKDNLRPMVQFNGTKFGKGRYKANRKDESLETDLRKKQLQEELIN